MHFSTQNAIDRLRRGIEAAKIEAARLKSVLGAPSAQAAPLPTPPVPYAPFPVYPNLPVHQPSATALNFAAASFLPSPAVRLPEQVTTDNLTLFKTALPAPGTFRCHLSSPPRTTVPQRNFPQLSIRAPARVPATFLQQNLLAAPQYEVPFCNAHPPAPPPPSMPPPLALPASAASPSPHPSGAPGEGGAAGSSRGGAADGLAGGPGDPDVDPDKKKRDKEIDEKRKDQFLFDRAALNAAKNRSRGSIKCEFFLFERGTKLTIQDWINQMETYFTIEQISRIIRRVYNDENRPATPERDHTVQVP